MKEIRNKREQLIKNIQSKQRNERISSKRGLILSNCEDHSLVSLIFLFID